MMMHLIGSKKIKMYIHITIVLIDQYTGIHPNLLMKLLFLKIILL